MTAATISWQVDWSKAPLLAPAACRHPGPASLAIGARLEKVRHGRRAVVDATLCMLCGSDSSDRMSAEDVLDAAWKEHGWHRSTGERILLLAERLPAGADA